jgi:hypothetical protein
MFISQFDITWIVWFILVFVMMFLYPVMMLQYVLARLQQTLDMISGFSSEAKKMILKTVSKKTKKDVKDAINNFLEFFMIEPISLDPYGIVKKLEHISNLSEEKFKHFVRAIVPNSDTEFQANLAMGLSSALSLYQIEKLIRHYVELVKKTKNSQLGLILQMQLPMVERLARALLYGTEAFTNNWPIGDSFGAMVATRLIGNSKGKEMEEDTLVVRKRIRGKDVFIVKAKGPGGRLGKLGKVVEKLVKKHKVRKIITVDAAAKLEGEKTGTIAEGIGVAIGGIGVDRSYIENIATSKNIPLDSFVVKMSQEEAISPMPLEVFNSVEPTVKRIEENIAASKGPIVVVGVGNSCGVGNDEKSLKETESLIRKNARMMKKREEEEKKKAEKISWFRPFGF